MLEVTLVCPSALVAKEQVDSVILPGSVGYMDIRTNHAALLAELSSGLVTLKREGFEKAYFVSGGYAQVQDNKLILLADVADSQDAIDIERAKEAEKRAKERLSKTSDETIEIQRAMASLKRAQYRQSLYLTRGSGKA